VNDLRKPKKKCLYNTSEPHVTSVTDLIKSKKKYFYLCDCACCKDVEVDSHTREKHLNNEIL
jgi:hypothetical protein